MQLYKAFFQALEKFDREQACPISIEREVLGILLPLLPTQAEHPLAVMAELYAFSLIEEDKIPKRDWGTYFGPKLLTQTNGTEYEDVPRDSISIEVVDYWESRINAVSNPLLKARYAGLVWEFSVPVRQVKASFPNVGAVYVRSLLQLREEGRFKHASQVFSRLTRAWQMASLFRNDELKREAVVEIREYEKKVGDVNKPGLWKYSYLLFVKNSEISTTLTNEIIGELEMRLLETATPQRNGVLDTNAASLAVDYLAEYYNKTARKKDVKRVIEVLKAGFEDQNVNAGACHKVHFLDRIFELYKRFGFRHEANEVYIEIQKASAGIMNEMKLMTSEFTMPISELDAIMETITIGIPEEIIGKLVINFVPDDQPSPLDLFRQGGIAQFLSHNLHDATGRRVANIASVANNPAGKKLNSVKANLQLLSPFLEEAMRRNIENGTIQAIHIIDYVKQSSFVTTSRYEIIEVGINAIFNKNYIVALPVLIPQLEAACVEIIKTGGGSIWKEGKHDGDNVRILDDLLRDSVLEKELGEEITYYFRVLLTDQRGWNLRNRVCHGLIDSDKFTARKAYWVLVALLQVCAHGRKSPKI